jgi:transglutaminase-like putative cysteine protease
MIYDVSHRTEIAYEQSVSEAHHVLHLMPRACERQQRIAFVLDVDPVPSQLGTSEDYFGNLVHHLTIHEPHHKLIIESRSRVEVRAPAWPIEVESGPTGPIESEASPAWESVAARLGGSDSGSLTAQQFIFDSPQVATSQAVRAYAAASFTPGRALLAAVLDLTERIFDEFEYQGGVSDVATPVARVLEMRRGVCQDFAHLQIACLRSLGLAARYVSGYLLTHPPAGQPRLVGADASHAWVSVWTGGDGWLDFDPTNRLIPGDEHITVGWGRDYTDVSPNNGFIIGGGEHKVSVAVDVSPVAEAAADGA